MAFRFKKIKRNFLVREFLEAEALLRHEMVEGARLTDNVLN